MSQKPCDCRAVVNMASEPGEKHDDGADRGGVEAGVLGDGEDRKPAPISFGFSKTASKFKFGSKRDEGGEREDLSGVELGGSKPVEQPEELVIPLIAKNRWYRQENLEKGPSGRRDAPLNQEPDSVESQAIKELVAESQKQQEQWMNGTKEGLDLTIPLLMQNRVPQGYEEKEKVKVDLRPESSTDTDYKRVPVEAFGQAVLRGMGWKEGEGIGRTFKQVMKPIKTRFRPQGLGLGADRSALKDLEPTGSRQPPNPGEERSQEELVLGPGAVVLLKAGAHKDHYGKVESVDADNSRVMVKLAIGKQTVTVNQHAVQLVGRKEYDRNARDLSRHSKAHKEAERERKKEKERREERVEKDSEQQRSGRGKGHKLKRASSREKSPPAKQPCQESTAPCWLQRDLRVRFIDKTFHGGKYYNSKMIVEDVLTPQTCVCLTDGGRLLDGVKQEMLETVVPKSESDNVMVVLGEHRGQVGRILQRDRERCQALVQLYRQEEKAYTLDYDSICHYVGGNCV